MYRPVALFVYKRPEHTRLTLEALARNLGVEQTPLFVFSDGPRTNADLAAVEKVRSVVRSISGFSSVTLIEREKNMGLARSIIAGVSELLARYDSVIVLEDDLVTSQHFLPYMNVALSHYKNDPHAFSVTGHTFPEPFLHIPQDYPFDTYVGYRCSSWSWGTWRDRWERVDWDMSYFPSFCQDTAAQKEFNRGGQDMVALLNLQHEGRVDSWAIRFCYAHHANDMRCIYPTRTLVRNIGLDNTGTHSKPEARFFHTNLDAHWRPKRFCPAAGVDPRIAESFRSVFDPPPSDMQTASKARRVRSLARRAFHSARRILGPIRRRLFPSLQEVDILVVNTLQRSGGAARAAHRLFCSIQRLYPQAHYLNLLKDDLRPEISGRYRFSFKGLVTARLASRDLRPLARYPNRQNVPFTPACWANPLRVPLSRFKAKIVHLHWVAFSLLRVEELGRLNGPVVWTLHDTWAFTGGCHYIGDCDGFQRQCGCCPQLGSTQDADLSRSLWLRKKAAYSRLNLTVVAPSRWMASIARKSSLFAGRRIEVIPNGLDTDVFRPIEKKAAKSYLDVDPAHPVLLFGAEWLTVRRKGGDLLCLALEQLDFPCTLLTFGEGKLPALANPLVTARSVGSLADEISLALVYSAADVFLCPSREDNLPNTVAEAMACGTPVVAFDVNGLPDMIAHRTDGWLAKPFDVTDYVSGIRWIVQHPNPQQLHESVRAKALTEYSLQIMSERYGALYAEILSE